MREKIKWIPLLAKTSHRVNSQLDPVASVALQQYCSEDTPMGRSAFVFGLGSKNFVSSIVFPTNNVRSSKNCKVTPFYEEMSPRVEESLAYPSYPGRANVYYISLPKLGV